MQKSMGGAIFAGAAVGAAAASVTKGASANVDDVQPESKPEEVVTTVEPVPAETPVEESKAVEEAAEAAPVEDPVATEPPKDEVKEAEPAVDNAAM
jgi:hypothetical protein